MTVMQGVDITVFDICLGFISDWCTELSTWLGHKLAPLRRETTPVCQMLMPLRVEEPVTEPPARERVRLSHESAQWHMHTRAPMF